MRGHVEERTKGTWTIVIEDERDPVTGKRQRIYRAFNSPKKKDAEKEMQRLILELESGISISANEMTLNDYIVKWLATYAKPKLSPKTYRSYEQLMNMHVIPSLGGIKLAKLKPLHLQALYAELTTSGRKDGKEGGLSRASLTYIHRVLHKAFDMAVKWQILARNIVDAVELPAKGMKQEMQSLDEEQVGKMMRAAEGTPYYGPILLAVMTGLRRGEIFGLRWSDVDLVSSRLHIRQTIQYTPEQGVFFKEPKTDKSARSVLVAPSVVEMLRQRRKQQLESRLILGDIYEDHDLVFCRDTGKPTHPDTISSWFPAFMEDNGLPRIRFHDLRHTHATLLIKEGVDVKVVSQRLGHSSTRITYDTYTHVLPDQQEDAAMKLEKLMPKKA